MSSSLESNFYEENRIRSQGNRRIAKTLAFIAVLSALIILPFYSFFQKQSIGPRQPIPFSHRVHAGTKEISCLICHPDAPTSDYAGIPGTETCMLCHSKIIKEFSPIRDLHAHFHNKQPILWNKVAQVPDYSYFSHRVHVQRGIDCGNCHGDVKGMDRIEQVHDFNMGFCLDCHRAENAPIGCYTCHR